MPSGAASRQTKRTSLAPRALILVTAAIGRIGGREHRVDDDHQAVGEVVRRLEEVLVRLQRLGIAIDADMRDARRGDEVEHALEEAVAGAQDRGEDRFLAFEDRGIHFGKRRVDLLGGELQVAGDLVGDQLGDLAKQLTEIGRRRVASRIRVSLCWTSGWLTTFTGSIAGCLVFGDGRGRCSRLMRSRPTRGGQFPGRSGNRVECVEGSRLAKSKNGRRSGDQVVTTRCAGGLASQSQGLALSGSHLGIDWPHDADETSPTRLRVYVSLVLWLWGVAGCKLGGPDEREAFRDCNRALPCLFRFAWAGGRPIQIARDTSWGWLQPNFREKTRVRWRRSFGRMC